MDCTSKEALMLFLLDFIIDDVDVVILPFLCSQIILLQCNVVKTFFFHQHLKKILYHLLHSVIFRQNNRWQTS